MDGEESKVDVILRVADDYLGYIRGRYASTIAKKVTDKTGVSVNSKEVGRTLAAYDGFEKTGENSKSGWVKTR